jgi:hypothetical protein
MVQKGSTGLQMARIAAGEALLLYSTAIVAAKTFEEEMTYLSLSRNSKSISRGLTCPALVDFLQHFVNILPYCALCPSHTLTGS